MKKRFKNAANGGGNPKKQTVKLALALQGGGSYGAFTKGVLKSLLESNLFRDGKVEVSVVTGTSAGAVNGTLLTYGLNAGGPDKAIKMLDRLWDDIGKMGEPLKYAHLFNWSAMGGPEQTWPNIPAPVLATMNLYGSVFGVNVPSVLKSKLDDYIKDWDKVRNGNTRLYVNAVEVDDKTGARSHKTFTDDELCSDAIAASGALEQLGAHKINGKSYFDGAYWANPSMSVIDDNNITDVLAITLHKADKDVNARSHDQTRADQARPGHELMLGQIHNHLEHMHENRKDLHLHHIGLEVEPHWGQTSRLNTDPDWLAKLEKIGYEEGRKWLATKAPMLGKSSTFESAALVKPAEQQDTLKPKK